MTTEEAGSDEVEVWLILHGAQFIDNLFHFGV